MKTITLHCAGIETKQQLHAALASALNFPEWYGHNLDALYDCLTELRDIHLVLAQWQTLPEWSAAFQAVLQDAENDTQRLIITFA